MAKQPKSQQGPGVGYALILVLFAFVVIVILTTWSKQSNSGGFLAPSPAYAAELITKIYVAEPDPPFGSWH